MKRILMVAAASILAACPALAADLPVRTVAPAYYPVPVVYDWGGGYIGINGGYAFGQSEWGSDPFNPSGLSSTGNFNVNGGLVGGTMGVSGQFGAWVVGVEGDFDWQGLSGTSSSAFCTSLFASPNSGSPAGLSCKTASNWFGTFRARFGYAWDRVLLYGTAGGAGVNVQTSLNGLPAQTNPEFGWTVGAGLEWAFAENWTAKVEYLFVDLAQNAVCNHGYSCGYDAPATNAGLTPAVNSNSTVKLNENIVRVGVNFKFGHYRPMKSKTAPSITGFGRRGVIFEEEDVVRLLRVEIKKDGSQAAWARRLNIDRPNVNAMLSGRIPVSKIVADALGLRRTYTAK